MSTFQELTDAAAGRDPAASSAAFISLMRLVVTDPASYLHKSFSFFTHHIDPSHIPTSLYGRITPVMETDIERALQSLKGISLIGAVYRDDRSIIDSLVRLWDDVWTWLCFLHTFCIDEDRAAMLKRVSVFAVVSNIHHTYSSHERLRAATEFTKGYLEMIVQQWTLQIRIHDFIATSSIYPLASILAAYTNTTGTTVPATTVRVITALGGNPNDVARLCLEHLSKTSELAHSQHAMALAAGADIELMTNFRVSAPMRYALLGRHSVRAVTSVLLSFSSMPFSSESRESASFYLNSCSRFIGYALEFSNGFNAITEALEAQLLPAMLRCGPWLAQMNPSMVTQFLLPLTAILPKYLLYPSILKIVSRALRRVRSLGVESRIAQPSALWDAWKRFKTLAEERINSLLQSGDTQDKYQACHLASVSQCCSLFSPEPPSSVILCFHFTCLTIDVYHSAGN
ncbi:hypothetical protein AX16_003284 [Volvariella volvacea WC 439]|nr:hypothetical protein AX16_003284 [Volvariella volvacea WC 439]